MRSNSLPEQDIISKIETVEGSTLYVICRFKSHPLNLKTFFSLGHITVFEDGRKNGYFKGEMISLNSLNQHMEWTSDYFNKLRTYLEEQKKDVTYSFSTNAEDPDSQTKFFKITFKISQKAEIIGLNVECGLISTKNVLENLMKEMAAIDQTKKKTIETLQTKIGNLEAEKMVILENLNDVAQAKEQGENHLLEKFTVILNEKKKKIITLQKEIDMMKNVPLPQKDPVTGIIERVRRTETEDEMPTQLSTYHLDINGSQMNWMKEPKPRPKPRNQQEEIIQSGQSNDLDEIKIEEYYERPANTNGRKQRAETGNDLEDLFH